MRDLKTPALPKWPFFAGDLLLLGTAVFITRGGPPGLSALCLVSACVAIGAVLGVTPFLLEYWALLRIAEAQGLTTVVAQVRDLEKLAAQITGATGRWQEAQEQADKTAGLAKSIAE